MVSAWKDERKESQTKVTYRLIWVTPRQLARGCMILRHTEQISTLLDSCIRFEFLYVPMPASLHHSHIMPRPSSTALSCSEVLLTAQQRTASMGCVSLSHTSHLSTVPSSNRHHPEHECLVIVSGYHHSQASPSQPYLLFKPRFILLPHKGEDPSCRHMSSTLLSCSFLRSAAALSCTHTPCRLQPP